MESIFLLALLASNIFLIKKLLDKPGEKQADKSPPETTTPSQPSTQENDDDSICGHSHVDMERINALHEAKMKALEEKVEKMEETITRIESELTRPEDVGLPPELPEQSNPQVPNEKLDEVFTHTTVSETTGDTPEPQEPNTDGDDFNTLESAVRVAKDLPHTPEEAQAAKETLAGLQGTKFEEQLQLDPEVRVRLLTIVFGDENENLSKEVIEKKKVVYTKTIDTTDVDQINLNILT